MGFRVLVFVYKVLGFRVSGFRGLGVRELGLLGFYQSEQGSFSIRVPYVSLKRSIWVANKV